MNFKILRPFPSQSSGRSTISVVRHYICYLGIKSVCKEKQIKKLWINNHEHNLSEILVVSNRSRISVLLPVFASPLALLKCNWWTKLLCLRYTMWYFDTCIHCEMSPTIKLFSTSITSHSHLFLCGWECWRSFVVPFFTLRFQEWPH